MSASTLMATITNQGAPSAMPAPAVTLAAPIGNTPTVIDARTHMETAMDTAPPEQTAHIGTSMSNVTLHNEHPDDEEDMDHGSGYVYKIWHRYIDYTRIPPRADPEKHWKSRKALFPNLTTANTKALRSFEAHFARTLLARDGHQAERTTDRRGLSNHKIENPALGEFRVEVQRIRRPENFEKELIEKRKAYTKVKRDRFKEKRKARKELEKELKKKGGVVKRECERSVRGSEKGMQQIQMQRSMKGFDDDD